MKKLLSLLLVFSLCLSSVILLASCGGKSAYEVAVENGFEGDEKAWLESLNGEKGADGANGADGDDGANGDDGFQGMGGNDAYQTAKKDGFAGDMEDWFNYVTGKDGTDGKSPVVTVNEDGYWVIDGVPTTTMVDGKKYTVTDLELVEDTFTVLLGNAEKPTLEIKYTSTSEDGTSTVDKVIPIGDDNVSPAIDFSKGGEQKVTVNYAGFSKEVTVKIESMMVLFEDFSSFTNESTMAEILAGTGFKIPVPGPNNPKENGLMDLQGNPIKFNEYPMYNTDQGDLSAYTLPGYFAFTNFFDLKVEEGKLYMAPRYAHDFIQAEEGDNVFEGKEETKDTYSNSSLVLADEKYMALAGTGAFTVQMDFTLQDASFKFDSSWQAIMLSITQDFTHTDDDGTQEDGTPIMNGVGFAFQGRLSATMHTLYAASSGKKRDVLMMAEGLMLTEAGNQAMTNAVYKSTFNGGVNNISLFDTLFPNDALTTWSGQTVTIRVVVKGTTETDWGYDLYAKKAGDPDSAFVYVGSTKEGTVTSKDKEINTDVSQWGKETYLNGDAYISLFNWGTQKRKGGYWIDNVAIWTGTGDMPENTDTLTYQYLNEDYLASLVTPAN